MFQITLSLHNILRWVVLVLGIIAAALAWMGWLRKREWAAQDRKWGTFYGIAADIQLLLGLLLYFVFSPLTTQTVLPNFSAAMRNGGEARFFGLEHVIIMFIAVVLAHLGSVFTKRAKDSTAKFRQAAIWYSLSLLVLLVGIPWYRPLLRLG